MIKTAVSLCSEFQLLRSCEDLFNYAFTFMTPLIIHRLETIDTLLHITNMKIWTNSIHRKVGLFQFDRSSVCDCSCKFEA